MTANRTGSTILLAVTLAMTVPGQAGGARAEACGPKQITARYAWLAKLKARANWRAKVRAMPDLGAEWSTWSRATDTEERCLSGPEGTLCIFTGTPCRS